MGAATDYWPTPTARDSKPRGPSEMNRRSPGLSALAFYPTPRTSRTGDADNHGKMPQEFRSGMLNPRWVEWLIGLPIRWARLEPSETESYRR